MNIRGNECDTGAASQRLGRNLHSEHSGRVVSDVSNWVNRFMGAAGTNDDVAPHQILAGLAILRRTHRIYRRLRGQFVVVRQP